MTLTLLEYVRILVGVLTLSAGLSLLLAMMISPRRGLVNLYFSGFSLTLIVYSLLILAVNLPSFSVMLDRYLAINMLAIMLLLLITTFYLFVVRFINAQGLLVRYANWGLVIDLIVTLFAVLSGQIFESLDLENFRFKLSYLGIVLVFGAVAYSFVCLYLVWKSDEERARWLRQSAILIAVGYVFTIIFPDLPVDMFFFMVASLWGAWAVIRLQVMTPMVQMNQQLVTTNDQLRSTILQLEHEKDRVDLLNQELSNANRYKNEFLANISHELRTPLNSIIGYSELLASPLYGELNQQQSNRLERILRNGKHLLELINTILDLSRLDAGEFHLEIAPFQVETILNLAIERIAIRAKDKALRIDRQFVDKLPRVQGDFKRIEQVFYNVLDNAVKFTNEGYVKVSASVKVVSSTEQVTNDVQLSAGQWVLVVIEDSGVGIAPEHVSNVFGIFYQTDASSTREYGGMGMGLAIAKRIVDLHAGRIWFATERGVGTKVYIALPIV